MCIHICRVYMHVVCMLCSIYNIYTPVGAVGIDIDIDI
jgi:hypothetical protein